MSALCSRPTTKSRWGDAKVNGASGDSALLINGRVLAKEDLSSKIPVEGPDAIYMQGDTVIAARLSGEKLGCGVVFDQPITKELLPEAPVEQVEGIDVISWPWDFRASQSR